MPNKFANSQDLVLVEEVRENALVLKNGSLRQILMVEGLNFSLKSTEEQNVITAAYQNFLNSLDFPVQIVIHSRKINIQKYLNDLTERMQAEPSPLLQNQIAEYRDFIGKFVEENAIMEKSFLVVVPWYPSLISKKVGVFGNLPFLKPKEPKGEQPQAEKNQDFEQNLIQLKQRVGQVMEGLLTIGLEAIVLNNEELIELIYNFYNPETVEKESLNLAPENGTKVQ